MSCKCKGCRDARLEERQRIIDILDGMKVSKFMCEEYIDCLTKNSTLNEAIIKIKETTE